MSADRVSRFRWEIPERFNLGAAVCDHWATGDPNRIAIIELDEDWNQARHSYAALSRRSAQVSQVLASHGIRSRGAARIADRVGVLLPQSFDTAAAHVAIMRMGAISLPLSTLFGPEALLHRLGDSGASALIVGQDSLNLLAGIIQDLPDLRLIVCKSLPEGVSGEFPGVELVDLDSSCAAAAPDFPPADLSADDPALIIYTSGTTGSPKGALHAQRVLIGHLPGVEVSHDLFPQPGDRMWTPADWAWIGGLLDVLLPSLYHGVTVVACRFRKFTAEAGFRLMRELGIRNCFLPPTALKMMRLAPASEAQGLQLRSIASGGEPLGSELIDWGRRIFGTTINEFYGQTECNMTVSCCSVLYDPVPGVMGHAAPGHLIAIVAPETGTIQPDGSEGEIAVLAPDPVMFLEYWNNPEATRRKFVTGPNGRWLLTGDRGRRRDDDRFVFVGRDDDVINSAGYRIGPAEIEDCLIRHPAVKIAGVVGQSDPLRGQIVAAFVTLTESFSPSAQLASDISRYVRDRLAAYEYPRSVYFIDEMPTTSTGKIIRAELRRRADEFTSNRLAPPT